MPRLHRIQLFWPGRTDGVPLMGRQIARFLADAAALHPKLGGFLFAPQGVAAPLPASSPEACEEALRRSADTWFTGEIERVSYAPRFFLERSFAPPLEVTVTCGIEPLNLGPIFTPNRLDLRVSADLGDERCTRPVLEGLLRAAVLAFRPDFAFAGSESIPQAPLAIFSDGAPAVGWMTYLRHGFPEIPRSLPHPAVAYPLAPLGTLLVAHPEPFDERSPTHRAAVERVREVLVASKVLVPAVDLPPA